MFFVAILDYVYQRFEFMKQMRMSKKEIKDEHKQQEGDPMIKGKLRQIRMERARQRMMANVPSADVVITNPTHYAIALKYETGTMRAPILVAKGWIRLPSVFAMSPRNMTSLWSRTLPSPAPCMPVSISTKKSPTNIIKPWPKSSATSISSKARRHSFLLCSPMRVL